MNKTISTQTMVNVPLSATSAELVTAAANRVALIISAPPTNRFTLSLSPTAVLDQGITLYPLQQPLILTRAQHGDLVTRAWSATSAVAAQNVTVVGVFEA